MQAARLKVGNGKACHNTGNECVAKKNDATVSLAHLSGRTPLKAYIEKPVLIPFRLGVKDADGGIVGASRKEWESARMEPQSFTFCR